MNESKPWYASRTNITNIVTFGATVLTLFGIDLPPDMQTTAVTAVVALGTLMSTYFRNVARTRIG
ncbi:MAG: hypothetical protein OXR62_10965 [Ahrensia sp.]|nr:hypothetical protein [Ahrensia sp.]